MNADELQLKCYLDLFLNDFKKWDTVERKDDSKWMDNVFQDAAHCMPSAARMQ